jgi:DNA-binding MarR family transcriptional regulator
MVDDGDPAEAAVDALMSASRLVTAVVSHSLSRARSSVTTPQLRVLVMLSTRGELTLGAVAQGLAVNASNASRTCDQLVGARLVLRRVGRSDRRNVVLRLSAKGSALVDSLMAQRRAVFAQVVAEVDDADQAALARGLGSFLDAAERVADPGPVHAHDTDLMPWLT